MIADRYNPHNVSLLEEYLDVQIKDGQHDLFANLAILKLYQFNPTMVQPKVVIDILLLSLISPTTLDSPDFSLAQSLALDRPSQAMLKQQNYDDEEDAASHVDEIDLVLPFLRKAWKLLKECRFKEFWSVWKSEEGEGAERELSITTRYMRAIVDMAQPSLYDLASLTYSKCYDIILPLVRISTQQSSEDNTFLTTTMLPLPFVFSSLPPLPLPSHQSSSLVYKSGWICHLLRTFSNSLEA